MPNTLKEVWAVRNWLATNASLREESKRERERERERERKGITCRMMTQVSCKIAMQYLMQDKNVYRQMMGVTL